MAAELHMYVEYSVGTTSNHQRIHNGRRHLHSAFHSYIPSPLIYIFIDPKRKQLRCANQGLKEDGGKTVTAQLSYLRLRVIGGTEPRDTWKELVSGDKSTKCDSEPIWRRSVAFIASTRTKQFQIMATWPHDQSLLLPRLLGIPPLSGGKEIR